MTSTTITLLAATSLCLAFAETRAMGIIAVVVLGYLYPLSLLVAVVIAAAGAYAFRFL